MDLAFRGDVTLRDALQQSLNIPALRVAEAFGAEALLDALRSFGLSTLDRTPERYGLGLALGAAEVTLLDLTNAYAALARGGAWIPYRLARQQPESVGRRALVSPAAAYLVNCMLEAPSRLIDLRGYGEGADGPRLAWKTGTSSGGRDAWTIAYKPDVVVGVWVGTLSGPAPQGAVGIRDAAPMAFQILRRLYPDKKGPWFPHPPDVVDRDLCPISGQYAGPNCPIHIRGPVITDISQPGLCSTHQSATRSPTHSKAAFHITSPPDGSTYRRTQALPANRQQLPLTADAPEASTLHWFVNGTHLATQRDEQPVSWPLQPGTHTIACADESGHVHQVQILVH
jgi:penicillin-binding protein 1C